MHRTAVRDLRAQEKKLAQAAGGLAHQLQQHTYTKSMDEDEFHIAAERLQVALLLLGMQAKETDGKMEYDNLLPVQLSDFLVTDCRVLCPCPHLTPPHHQHTPHSAACKSVSGHGKPQSPKII
jgi:hypothetical protein